MPIIRYSRGLTAIAAVVLSGCANIQFGHDFELSRFTTQVQHDVTTQQQVLTWLGPPASTGIVVDTDGERFQRWMYYHGTGKLTRMDDAAIKTLEIQFNADNVVKSYNWVGQ